MWGLLAAPTNLQALIPSPNPSFCLYPPWNPTAYLFRLRAVVKTGLFFPQEKHLPCRPEVSGVVVEENGAKAETAARETVVGAAVLPEVEEQAEAQPPSFPSVPVPVMAALEVGEEEVTVVGVEGDLMGAVDGVLIGAEEEVLMGVAEVDVVVAEVGEEDEAALTKAHRCTRE